MVNEEIPDGDGDDGVQGKGTHGYAASEISREADDDEVDTRKDDLQTDMVYGYKQQIFWYWILFLTMQGTISYFIMRFITKCYYMGKVGTEQKEVGGSNNTNQSTK